MDCARCHHYTGDKQNKSSSHHAKRLLNSQIHDVTLVEDAVILADLCLKLRKCIPDLPDAERTIIEGLLCGKSEHQIATELGTKQSTVNFRKHKAFEHIRRRLE
jgi:DNA-directed RNA polymerase specialized sigma24 family protein